jgi:outer membrane lipoprotein-sorting protein
MQTIKFNQQGIAHIMMLVLAVVVIGGIGFAGYEVTQKNKTATKSSQSPAKVATDNAQLSICQKQLNDANLCKFATNVSKLDSTAYSLVMTSSDGNGSSSLSIKNDGVGGTEGSIKSGGLNYDIIAVPKYTFIKNEDGSWTRYPADSPDAPPTSNPLSDFKLSENNDYTNGGKITFQKLGQEACGNLSCFKYNVVDKSDSSNSMNSTVWFDTKNYQLRRMQYKDPSGGGSVDLTITYENVKVTPPANYTDFKAGP